MRVHMEKLVTFLGAVLLTITTFFGFAPKIDQASITRSTTTPTAGIIMNTSNSVEITNTDDFVQYLKNFALKKTISAYWTTTDCIQYETSETPELLKVGIYEKHGGKCSGDPNTSPALVFFTYDKSDKHIYWNDVVNGIDKVPFEEYVSRNR